MNKPTTKDLAHFMTHVQVTDHCWLWIGSTNIPRGYGRFGLNGKSVQAHRFSYRMFVGSIEPGKHILHKRECGNRTCVNPHHLYQGTHTDNMRDMRIWGDIAIGEKHGRSKLSEFDVISIREIHKNTRRGYKATADVFGVDQSLIGFIVRGDLWKHLT